jgi:hypothetical protein
LSVWGIDVLQEPAIRRELTWITDSELGLPGEDPSSTEVRVAVHWTQVYRELLEMTSALLERSESTLRAMNDDAAREGADTQRVLRAQREQYLARYDFWRDRAGSLSADAN